jgi:type IV pilus assembly protein PilB
MANDRINNDVVLQLIEENGLLDEEQLTELMNEAEVSGKSIRHLVLDMELLTEEDIVELIANYMGTRVVNLPATDIPQDVIHAIPASIARMYNVVPVEADSSSLLLATSELMTPEVCDELMFALTRDINFVLAFEDDVKNCINQSYGDESDTVNDMLASLESEIDNMDETLDRQDQEADGDGIDADAANSTPVIRFVNLVLFQAVQSRSSDIHFEPFEKEFRIRYRVDGALLEMAPPPLRLAGPVISRIKVMAGLNIAERRLPQDGRIQITVAGKQIDLRVSTLPTQGGESVVLRVLDRNVVALEIDNLGMPDDVRENFVEDIAKPNGIIIVTGPTGSGKTTTLYSGLGALNTIERKILTAEEPVEYDIEGLIQVPINNHVGNTFAKVLRAFLRQDPDIIMIGEIRDLETAQIAVQSALTGHLVFSTLHTNDAPGAVTRLVDMDVEPYLVSSTLQAILGQRLVRTICSNCKTAYTPDKDQLELLGLTQKDTEGRPFYFGKGCPVCDEKGYKGRKGLYEYLRISEPIKLMINERRPTLELMEKAVELGMRTLREDGIRNILDGYTTIDEVIKYT